MSFSAESKRAVRELQALVQKQVDHTNHLPPNHPAVAASMGNQALALATEAIVYALLEVADSAGTNHNI